MPKFTKYYWPIIILPFLLITCKNYIGSYCTEPNYVAWCYTLKKDKTFSYVKGHCLGTRQGKGTYEITEDTIRFHFEPHTIAKGNYEVEKTGDVERGVIVALTAEDFENGDPLPGFSASVYVNEVLIGGQEGDLESNTRLAVAFNEETINIKVEFAGYHPVTIPIHQPGKYTATARLERGELNTIDKQTWIYRIVRLEQDTMILGGWEEGEGRQILVRKQ